MDSEIIAWVIEFVIRHKIPAPFLNAILTDPYFSVGEINNPRLKKTVCLRNIQDEIAGGAISYETVLGLLETIEEIDRKDGTLVSQSMKLAYRAAAVECTVKYLREEDEGRFFEAVKRIWIERIEKLERFKKSELIGDELKELKKEMVSASGNRRACERLLMENGEIEAVRFVRDYVEQAFAVMGPSFVEMGTRAEAELRLKREREASRQDFKRRRIDVDEVEVEEGNQSNADTGQAVIDRHGRQDDDGVETEEGNNADDGPDLIVLDRPASPEVGCSPEIPRDTVDSQSVETVIPSTKFSVVPTPEVLRVREALKRSCMELKALVIDPLPEALRVSDHLRAEIRGESTSLQNQDGNPPINPEASRETTEIINPVPSQQNVARKCSLMERNSTACTFEWSESIDGISQETANCVDTDKLPTEGRSENLGSYYHVRRRRPKKWSLEEEEGLREGVKRFGAGNWAVILNSNRDLFVNRKPVDLKDKWRNLTKHSE